MHGDSTDWTNNYSTKFFDVQQRGGWFTKDPPTITTKAGGALLLLLRSRLSLLLLIICHVSSPAITTKAGVDPN